MQLLAEDCETASLAVEKCVAAWLPVLHGWFGEDVLAEGVLALEGVAHVGA
jgi:D-alanine-D-alanine ligase-like ATP-grasp enzyme